MSTSAEVFREFYFKLVEMLPMDDAIFIAKLYSLNLLPGDLKEYIASLTTKADKATHFLDHVIKPSVMIGDGCCFNKLLNMMEDNEYQGVKKLAQLIKVRISEDRSNNYHG